MKDFKFNELLYTIRDSWKGYTLHEARFIRYGGTISGELIPERSYVAYLNGETGEVDTKVLYRNKVGAVSYSRALIQKEFVKKKLDLMTQIECAEKHLLIIEKTLDDMLKE